MKKANSTVTNNDNNILHYGFGNLAEFKRQMEIKDQAQRAADDSFIRIFKSYPNNSKK